ncbi:type II secretion system F family protein [Neptuniibacter sp. QD37_11]|uniref:type II secretion system F family protein n=1 Tax=Neptuniibacter sp. QD37_11 TaxID=3398209 RepID=UPI0039F63147
MSNAFEKVDFWVLKKTFSAKMRLEMYEAILTQLEDGQPIEMIIRSLSQEYKKYNKKDNRAKILDNISELISESGSLAEPLSQWVPNNEVMLIQAGEKTGKLADAIRNCIEAVNSIMAIRGAIISKSVYPVVLFSALIGFLLLFALSIIPQISEIMDPATWPPTLKVQHTMSEFIKNWGIFAALGFVGFVILVGWSLANWTHDIRIKFFDKLPPWSIYKAYSSSLFLISLSSLVKSGVPLSDAVNQLIEHANPITRKHLIRIRKGLSDGRSIGDLLSGGILIRKTAITVAVMAKGSDFKKSLERIGKRAIEDGIGAIKVLTGVMNNLALLMVAGYIIFSLYGFFELIQSIKSMAATI